MTAVQPTYAQSCGPFAITFDLTQLAAANFGIDGAAGGETAALVTLSLPSGTHNLSVPSSSLAIVPFTVSCLGTLDFDPALDSYVNGRGTSTLTVFGFPVTFDLTRLSAAGFNFFFALKVGTSTTAPVTLRLIPGTYDLQVPPASPSTIISFSVSSSGAVDYDPALDRPVCGTPAPPTGYLCGRGTSALTVWGFPVTLDLTRLSAAIFNFFFSLKVAGDTSAPVTLRLIPGTYVLQVPFSSPSTIVSFSVSNSGAVDYDPALDRPVCQTPAPPTGYLCGRGTSTLTVWGFPVTLDLTGLSAAGFDFYFGLKVGGSSCAPATLRLIPGLTIFESRLPRALR